MLPNIRCFGLFGLVVSDETNQKKECPVATMFVSALGPNELSS